MRAAALRNRPLPCRRENGRGRAVRPPGHELPPHTGNPARLPTLREAFIALLLALLWVPVAEIFLIIRVAGGLGIGETIGLPVVVSVVGAWMMR